MIIIKEGTLERIKNWHNESLYIVMDFDRTITIGSSDGSWGILSDKNLLPKEYALERQTLYNYYRSIEMDKNLDFETKNKFMHEWWNKHINLFIKYKLPEEVVKKATNNPNIMTFRKGAKTFLKTMNKKNIPVIIISAGIGNFIEQFLIKNNCDFDNIYILSNFIKFQKKIAVGMTDNIIHSLNKDEISLPLKIKESILNRKNVILFGDLLADIKMIKASKRSEALKIGFLEENIMENKEIYEQNFDIVCTNNTSYIEILALINF